METYVCFDFSGHTQRHSDPDGEKPPPRCCSQTSSWFVTMSSPQSNQDPSGAGSKHPPVEYQKFLESEVNLSLLDPAKWGWTAAGGVGDLLTPHEVS